MTLDALPPWGMARAPTPARWIAASVVSVALLTVALPARAWERLGDTREPALWTTGDSWLLNPDPNAEPLLRRGKALLSIQCGDGKPLAFLNHNFEVAADMADVSLQLDDGQVIEETWTADAADIVNRPPDPRAFVTRLLGHQRLRLVVTWPGAAPTATTFSVAGLDQAMLPLRAQCGW